MKRWWPGLLAAGAYAAVRLTFAPEAVNTHAIMYALVVEGAGANSLETYHPLYLPLLRSLVGLRARLGFEGRALFFLQLFSLAGAALQLLLLYRIAEKTLGTRSLAFAAAALAACSVNLWCWSLQTMPYTWALSAMLGGVLLLLEGRPLAAGALAGLAVGLDTAALALVLAGGLELWFFSKRRRRDAALFVGAALGGLLFSYGLYAAAGGALPGGPSAALAALPADIDPIYETRSLRAQIAAFAASTAPEDLPPALAAAVFALALWRRRRERAARLGALLFAGVLGFFILNDPHNRFVYASGLLLPIALLLPWREKRWAPGLAAALGVVVLARAWASPPDYLPARNPGFDEAKFVKSRVAREDALLALSTPDWLFQYAYDGHSDIVVLASPPDLDPVCRARAAGRTIWLASDALFRDGALGPEAVARRVEALTRTLRLGAPEVSPAGQHYYPVEGCFRRARVP